MKKSRVSTRPAASPIGRRARHPARDELAAGIVPVCSGEGAVVPADLPAAGTSKRTTAGAGTNEAIAVKDDAFAATASPKDEADEPGLEAIERLLADGLAVFTPSRAWLPYERVALVLQGGGALGAYQAGVYHGLAERGIRPNWVAGISIGALNAAVIAGNPPEKRVERLQQFWESICRPGFTMPATDWAQSIIEGWQGNCRRAANGFEAWRAVVEGQRGFFSPRLWPPLPGLSTTPDALSVYDTGPLKATLERFVDFDRLNSGEVRVSVSAVSVATGNFQIFDTRDRTLRAEHFMASGALPPGFPAIEIDGEFYWDGGLVSNTPLFPVLLERPRANTLVFQVDLFSARGRLPSDVFEAEARRKDIVYSSRTRMATQHLAETTHQRRLLRELLDLIPADVRTRDDWCRQAAEQAALSQINVIHLIYRSRSFEGAAKDFEFSAVTMRDHWSSGLRDFRLTCQHPEWFDLPADGAEYVTHDVHRLSRRPND